jgi:hypothetical protein
MWQELWGVFFKQDKIYFPVEDSLILYFSMCQMLKDNAIGRKLEHVPAFQKV